MRSVLSSKMKAQSGRIIYETTFPAGPFNIQDLRSSVRGTLAAALVLGVVESFGTIYLGQLLDRNAIAFAFLILVLMVRPQGLFAKR